MLFSNINEIAWIYVPVYVCVLHYINYNVCALQIEETTKRFVGEYEKLYKAQIQDEIMLSEKIDTLVGNITNVALQTDINKVHEIAIEVKRIWKMIKECQETGLLLNKRQKLFGMDVVPFERLNKMIKDFEPYQTLWITASGNNIIITQTRDESKFIFCVSSLNLQNLENFKYFFIVSRVSR